jgi:hypothetical protein
VGLEPTTEGLWVAPWGSSQTPLDLRSPYLRVFLSVVSGLSGWFLEVRGTIRGTQLSMLTIFDQSSDFLSETSGYPKNVLSLGPSTWSVVASNWWGLSSGEANLVLGKVVVCSRIGCTCSALSVPCLVWETQCSSKT